jgi:hypothetical protein
MHQRLVHDLESEGISIVESQERSHAGIPRPLIVHSGAIIFQRPNWNRLQSSETLDHVSSLQQSFPSTNRLQNINLRKLTYTGQSSQRIKILLKAIGNKRLSPMLESSNDLSKSIPSMSSLSRRLAPTSWECRDMDVMGPLSKHDWRAHYQSDLRPPPLFSGSKSAPRSDLIVSKTRARAQTIDTTSSDSRSIHYKDKSVPHKRSWSLGNQHPGEAPVVPAPAPPLPLSAGSISQSSKANCYGLTRESSRRSISTVDSIGSSLLHGSPKMTRSVSVQIRKGANRIWASSVIFGPRLLSTSKTVHQPSRSWSGHGSLRSLNSICSMECNYSIGSSLNGENLPVNIRYSAFVREVATEEPTDFFITQSAGKKSVAAFSRKSKHDPEFQSDIKPRSTRHDHLSPILLPAVESNSQKSPFSTQASSTRSSNGNPFHWDSSPQFIARPSVRKGSPSSRKTPRKQKAVRLSLPPSPPVSMSDILEERTLSTMAPNTFSIVGFGKSHHRSLPSPPRSSNFAPALKHAPKTWQLCTIPKSFRERLSNLSGQDETQILQPSPTVLPTSSSFSLLQIPDLQGPSPSQRRETASTVSFLFEGPVVGPSQVPLDVQAVIDSVSSSRPDIYPSVHSDKIWDSAEFEKEELQPGEIIINFSDPSTPSSNQPAGPNLQTYEQETVEVVNKSLVLEDNAPPIRNSIALLRRMNSDVGFDSTRSSTRHYSGMANVDESPVPHELEPESLYRQFPWNSVEDHVQSDLHTHMKVAVVDSDLSPVPASGLNFHADNTNEGQQKRTNPGISDIWEDGEYVWDDNNAVSFLQCHVPISSFNKIPLSLHTSTPAPTLKVLPPTEPKTPASLYDENGFFKGEGFNRG